MLKLARKLQTLPDIGYTVYADDITLWATHGSLAQKEALQEAIHRAEEFAAESCLECAPEKSEVIRLHKLPYTSPGEVELFLGGRKINEADKIRILGLWVQSNLLTFQSKTLNYVQPDIWEVALTSEALDQQLKLVQQVWSVSESQWRL